MTIDSLYSKNLLSFRQKMVLYGAMFVCVVAFFYTYFAIEYVSHVLLISMADASPHVRLFLNGNSKTSDEIITLIKDNCSDVQALDKGILWEGNCRVTTYDGMQDIGEDKIFYQGKQLVQIIGYPFGFHGYKPPIQLNNVYSLVNQERLKEHPEDDPCLIITDPNETPEKKEELNWVIMNRKGIDYMSSGLYRPFRTSCMELLPISTTEKMNISYAGFFLNNPLSSTRQGSIPLQMITTISTAKKIIGENTKYIEIVDVCLKHRLKADFYAKKWARDYHCKTQSWTELNRASIPFLDGIKFLAFAGILAILFLSFAGIATLLSLLIQEKAKQMAILQALGIRVVVLRGIFVKICLKSAVFSVVVGGVFGSFFAYLSLPIWEKFMQNFCAQSFPCLYFSVWHILLYVACFMLVSALTAWFPSYSIATSDPIKHLRSE